MPDSTKATRNTISATQPKQKHPLKKMNLAVFPLSGNPSRIKEFQKGLEKSSSDPGNRPPNNNITHILENGFLTVENLKIPLTHLSTLYWSFYLTCSKTAQITVRSTQPVQLWVYFSKLAATLIFRKIVSYLGLWKDVSMNDRHCQDTRLRGTLMWCWLTFTGKTNWHSYNCHRNFVCYFS